MPDESHLPSGHAAEPHPSPAEVARGYEVRDTNVTAIITFGVCLFVFAAVAQVFLWGLLKGIAGGKPEPAAPMTTPDVITEQLRRLHAAEDATLGGYGWADHNKDESPKKGGPVRIPIDRAIDLLAERGLPPASGPALSEAEFIGRSAGPAPAGKDENDKGKEKDKEKADVPGPKEKNPDPGKSDKDPT